MAIPALFTAVIAFLGGMIVSPLMPNIDALSSLSPADLSNTVFHHLFRHPEMGLPEIDLPPCPTRTMPEMIVLGYAPSKATADADAISTALPVAEESVDEVELFFYDIETPEHFPKHLCILAFSLALLTLTLFSSACRRFTLSADDENVDDQNADDENSLMMTEQLDHGQELRPQIHFLFIATFFALGTVMTLLRQLHNLQAKHGEMQERLRRLDHRARTMRNAALRILISLREAKEELLRQLHNLQAEHREIQERLQRFAQKGRTMRNAALRILTALREAKEQLKGTTDALNKLKSQHTHLEADLNRQITANNKLQRELDQLKFDHGKLKEKAQELKKGQAVAEDLSQLRGDRITVLEKENAGLKAKNEVLQTRHIGQSVQYRPPPSSSAATATADAPGTASPSASTASSAAETSAPSTPSTSRSSVPPSGSAAPSSVPAAPVFGAASTMPSTPAATPAPPASFNFSSGISGAAPPFVPASPAAGPSVPAPPAAGASGAIPTGPAAMRAPPANNLPAGVPTGPRGAPTGPRGGLRPMTLPLRPRPGGAEPNSPNPPPR